MIDNLNKIASELQSPSIGMDRLAQYAQGTNPLIPQYMALAEIQRRQDLTKLEPGQASTTTVAQDLVTKALAPQMPMGMPGQAMPQQGGGLQALAAQPAPQGLPALPSGMNNQSFAGGGIVAFSGEDQSYTGDVPDLSGLSDAAQKAWEKTKSKFSEWNQPWTPPNITPAESRAALTGTYSRGMLDSNTKAARAQDQEDREGPAAVPRGIKATEQMAEPGSVPPSVLKASMPQSAPNAAAPAGAPNAAPTYASKVGSISPNAQAPGIQPKSDATNQYIEMLKEQMAEGKAGKEQDKYLRLLEAGLGIMGGTSPFAAVNIGQGATQAVRGYAQDVAAAGKANRETIGQMATIESKQQELAQEAAKTAVTAEHYKNMDANDRARIGVMAQGNSDAKMAQGVSTIFNTLANAHKNDIDKGDLDYATLYQQAQQMYNSTTGKNVGGFGAPVATQKPLTYDPTTRSFS
jgi:hypothetical protein